MSVSEHTITATVTEPIWTPTVSRETKLLWTCEKILLLVCVNLNVSQLCLLEDE